jgi:hypothetical protein
MNDQPIKAFAVILSITGSLIILAYCAMTTYYDNTHLQTPVTVQRGIR